MLANQMLPTNPTAISSPSLLAVVHAVKVAADQRFIILVVSLCLGGWLMLSYLVPPHSRARLWIGGFTLALAVFDLAFGGSLANSLIDDYGRSARGQIAARRILPSNNEGGASFLYLVQISDGSSRQTVRFSLDGVTVPLIGREDMPEVGESFVVRYLPGYPDDFVIIGSQAGPTNP